ncbi:MAG: hypothetical protein ABIB61_01985 [Candidatus Shapirobacteria bacterium]
MKRILTSLFVIGVVAGVITSATSAYFADEGEIQGVTFSTGNADLQMTQVYMHNWYADNASAADLDIHLPDDLYPGYEGSWGSPDGAIYLGNFSGSPIDLTVSASITNYAEDVAGLGDTIKLAMAWGGNCDNLGAGTGFHALSWWQSHSEDLFTYISGSADPATCGFIPNEHSGGYGGYARALKFFLKVPNNAGDEIANGVASFNIHFDAEQMH